MGAYADLRAAKKRLLALTTAGCVVGDRPARPYRLRGRSRLPWRCSLLSNFFFGSGENLVAAFLPELARGESLGRVSGWGWSLGYLGGILTLGLCLAYVTWAQGQGEQAQHFVPVTMLITAAVFAAASLPTFLLLKERARPVRLASGENVARAAFARLAQTVRARVALPGPRPLPGVHRLLPGRHPDRDRARGDLRGSRRCGFSTRDTITLILVVNVTAAVGAFAFGNIQDRIGHVRTIGAHARPAGSLTTLVAWAATGPRTLLGRREPRRPVPWLLPGGRTGARRVPEPGGPPRRVLRPLGAGGETVLDSRADHLRYRDLDHGRQPSGGHAGDRDLLRYRPFRAGRNRRPSRKARGARTLT